MERRVNPPEIEIKRVFALDYEFDMAIDTSTDFISSTIRKNHFYSAGDLVLYKKYLRPGGSFIDAGANIGWYSLVASLLVGPKGCVYAFEPESENRYVLEQTIKLNGITNIVVSGDALSDECSKQNLYLCAINKGDHSLVRLGQKTIDRPSVEVTTTTLDAFLTPEQFKRVDLMKIDIQGNEARLFKGMAKLMAHHRPVIILEFAPSHIHECGSSPFDIFAFIDREQYVPFEIHDNDYRDEAGELLTYISISDLFARTKKLVDDYGHCDLLLIPQEHANELAQC